MARAISRTIAPRRRTRSRNFRTCSPIWSRLPTTASASRAHLAFHTAILSGDKRRAVSRLRTIKGRTPWAQWRRRPHLHPWASSDDARPLKVRSGGCLRRAYPRAEANRGHQRCKNRSRASHDKCPPIETSMQVKNRRASVRAGAKSRGRNYIFPVSFQEKLSPSLTPRHWPVPRAAATPRRHVEGQGRPNRRQLCAS
jgi:hypothetical protein